MEILHRFGIQPTLLFAQIVNFTIILFVLKKFFYKPITKALEDRKKRIEESLKGADEIEIKLQKTAEQTAKVLGGATQNAKNIIQEAKAEAQRITDQAILEARQTQEEALQAARAQIEMQKEEMKKQLEKENLILVTEVVKKVLGRSLKDKEKRELTAKAAAEIGRQLH